MMSDSHSARLLVIPLGQKCLINLSLCGKIEKRRELWIGKKSIKVNLFLRRKRLR
jgi:hypothetical protein